MIGSFLIGLICGVVLYGIYDAILMWYDGLIWAPKQPIIVSEVTKDGAIVDEYYIPRTAEQVTVKSTLKEDVE